jgi:hypothetical protein
MIAKSQNDKEPKEPKIKMIPKNPIKKKKNFKNK